MKAMNALSMPTLPSVSVVDARGLSRSVGKSCSRRLQTFIRTGGDGDLGVRVQLPAPKRRIGVRDGFLQSGPALGGRILVTFHPVQRLLGGVQDELGRVVSEEALSHVHDGLLRRGCRSLVDDGPFASSVSRRILSHAPSSELCRV